MITQIRDRITQIEKNLDRNIRIFLPRARDLVRGSYFDTLSQPGRGQIYQFYGKTAEKLRERGLRAPRTKWSRLAIRGFHQASAPGDPPAPLTGMLRGNLGTHIYVGKGYYSVKLWPLADYAALLERGGFNYLGYYIAPRPFMRRVMHGNRAPIYRLRQEAIDTIRRAVLFQ